MAKGAGITGTPTVGTPTANGGSAPQSTWTVPVATTGVSGTGASNSTIGLNLNSASGIKDAAGNTLATSSLTGPTYLFDTTPPTATIAPAGSSPTSNAVVSWNVTFSEPVTGATASSFATVPGGGLGGSPAVTNVSGSGASYTVTASTGTGSGTLGLKIPSAGSITDQAGNPLAGTPVNGPAYTIVAPKLALFANDASCSAAGINATGSSNVVSGSTHSNGAYTVTGSNDTFGRSDAGCTPKVTGSGDTFGGLSAPSAGPNNEAFPETFSQSTVCAGAAHTGTSISITSGTPSGVYCYTSSISLTESNLTATVDLRRAQHLDHG